MLEMHVHGRRGARKESASICVLITAQAENPASKSIQLESANWNMIAMQGIYNTAKRCKHGCHCYDETARILHPRRRPQPALASLPPLSHSPASIS